MKSSLGHNFFFENWTEHFDPATNKNLSSKLYMGKTKKETVHSTTLSGKEMPELRQEQLVTTSCSSADNASWTLTNSKFFVNPLVN